MASATPGAQDQALITTFFLNHKQLLYSEARKYLSLQEDVEDIVCETLLRIIGKIDVFRTLSPGQQIQYAKVIVRNLSFIHLKRSAYFTMISFEEVDMYLPIDVQQQPEHIVTQQVQREQIRQIWAQMPAEERLLLEQKYILQCSDSELALGLGIQPQSVRMRLTRAKRRILKLLQQQSIRLEDWL